MKNERTGEAVARLAASRREKRRALKVEERPPERRRNEMAAESKAVVTVLGFDRKGIIAGVSNVLFERGVNILDISQTIVDGYFNMVMVVDLSEPTCPFDELQGALNDLGKEMGLQVRIQKTEIFEAMHQV